MNTYSKLQIMEKSIQFIGKPKYLFFKGLLITCSQNKLSYHIYSFLDLYSPVHYSWNSYALVKTWEEKMRRAREQEEPVAWGTVTEKSDKGTMPTWRQDYHWH